MIIALEESGEAELQETQGTASKKRQYDRAKAEDVRLKAMEKLSETKKRGSSANESDDEASKKKWKLCYRTKHKQSISWTFFDDAMAISAKESPKNHTDKERFASSCIATFSSPEPVVSWSRGRETRGSGRSRYRMSENF